MTDAVRADAAASRSARCGCNRLEAACLPQQRRLRARAGEGRLRSARALARRYLKINGEWQDHDLFALLHDDLRCERSEDLMRGA